MSEPTSTQTAFEIVVNGVRMVPAKLQELGYDFAEPDLHQALAKATGKDA